MGVLILTREDVRKVSDMKEVIEKVRGVYKLKSAGQSVVWPLVNYEFENSNAAMDIRSGYVMGEEQLYGMKMLSNFPNNIEKGLQTFNGLMLVNDGNTGLPLAVMDASYNTCMRTGAAGAIGVDVLARKDTKTLLIVGAGKQAPFQIAATLIVRPEIEKVIISNPYDHTMAVNLRDGIKVQLKEQFSVDAENVEFEAYDNIEKAVREADAIITVTRAMSPVIKAEWVKPGTHLSCLGSDMEGKQELDENILKNAKIYTDDKAQCIRVGEIELAIKHGVISPDNITGEIGQMLSEIVPGRESEDEITVFDATGLYLLDLVSAKVIIEKAKEAGIGLELDM